MMNAALEAPPARTGRKTMTVAAVVRPGRLEMQTQPVPTPGRGEVLVRLEGCGVCASNIPPWEGREWFRYPLPPGDLGHEGWGIVEETGSDVRTVRPGDHVATLSTRAYAQYAVSPAAEVIVLPRELEGRPFPGEPLGCAMNILCRCDIQPGQYVAIIGIGFLGALLTRLASRIGATVLAISRRPFSLELARRLGAAETIPMEDHAAIIERVREITGGAFCDRVVEAAGKQWPLDLAGELTGERGRLIVAGYHQDGPRQVNMQLWNWRGLDVINAHERDPRIYLDGIRAAAEEVAGGRLDPTPLYTHRLPFERLSEALELVRTRPDGFVKALVFMDGGDAGRAIL